MFEQLDAKHIISSIRPENQSKLASLEIFDSIDSTNSYLLMHARSDAPSGTVCFAEEQTKGRGRLGRPWISPLGGNLYCSILWRFSRPQQDMSGLGLAVATTIAGTLNRFGIQEGLQLKWPNDVLFARKKLAGILLESADRLSVVIGIGLNVFSAPEIENAISVSEILHHTPVRNALAGLLINDLLEKLSLFEMYGLRVFLGAWRQYDALCGKQILVHVSDKTLSGIMRGVDEQGRLLLEDPNGNLLQFCYGEVSVREG